VETFNLGLWLFLVYAITLVTAIPRVHVIMFVIMTSAISVIRHVMGILGVHVIAPVMSTVAIVIALVMDILGLWLFVLHM